MKTTVAHLHDALEMVWEFHDAFQMNAPLDTWATLIEEEAAELVEAIRENDGSIEADAHQLKETCDLLYVTLGFQVRAEELNMNVSLSHSTQMTISTAIAEALLDYGSAEFFEAFERVHLSNMSKLQDDGTPLRREDGKVLKGPNYQPAYLEDLV